MEKLIELILPHVDAHDPKVFSALRSVYESGGFAKALIESLNELIIEEMDMAEEYVMHTNADGSVQFSHAEIVARLSNFGDKAILTYRSVSPSKISSAN